MRAEQLFSPRFVDFKKKVALLKMTVSEPDSFEDVTRRLDALTIVKKPSKDLSETSGCDLEESSEKRPRSTNEGVTTYLQGSRTIFDPLLFLRASRPPYLKLNGNTEPAETPSMSVPSFEEIVAKSKSELLIEPICAVKREKTSRPRESTRPDHPKSHAPKLPVAVYRFCQQHEVKYSTIKISRTYRSIAFARNRPSGEKSDPWELYMDLNRLNSFRLCHGLYFGYTSHPDEEEHRLIVIVPHTSGETDVEKLKQTLNVSSIRRISLTHMEKELGFPTFVCPPFGHEYAPKMHRNELMKKFTTVIDTSLLSESTDCVFDLGIVAMRLSVSELVRLQISQHWRVVSNIVRSRNS
jgi:hypothetical protein